MTERDISPMTGVYIIAVCWVLGLFLGWVIYR